MISEFKHKGFLLPLEDTVMTEETAANFLQEYLKEICMSDGHIFFGTVQDGYHGILGEPGIAGSGWSGQTLLSQ